jgi:hypothetical protein
MQVSGPTSRKEFGKDKFERMYACSLLQNHKSVLSGMMHHGLFHIRLDRHFCSTRLNLATITLFSDVSTSRSKKVIVTSSSIIIDTRVSSIASSGHFSLVVNRLPEGVSTKRKSLAGAAVDRLELNQALAYSSTPKIQKSKGSH